MNVSNIDRLIEDLDIKIAERDKLYGQLKDSLRVQKLWPEAFDHGRPLCFWSGSPSKGWAYIIKRGDDSSRSFTIEEAFAVGIRPSSNLISIMKTGKQYREDGYK